MSWAHLSIASWWEVKVDWSSLRFGASGVILYALVTGLLLTWMLRRTEAGARST